MTELVSGFESLGDNCEFSFVMNAADLQTKTLLRRAWVSTPAALTKAIERGFEKIFKFKWIRPHYGALVLDTSYGIAFHSAIRFNEDREWSDPEDIRERIHRYERRRIKAQAAELLDTFRRGDRFFVYRARDDASEAEGRALLDAINVYGRNRLLVVNRKVGGEPCTVRALGGGLYMGVATLSSRWNIEDIDLPSWLELLENAREVDGARAPTNAGVGSFAGVLS